MLTRFATLLYIIGWPITFGFFSALIGSLYNGTLGTLEPTSWIEAYGGYAWMVTWSVRYILTGEMTISPFPTKAEQPESPDN